MTEVCRTIGASAERIFAVLADGWSYASWVVGAAHIRDVDDTWPEVGAHIHHRIGPWPIQLNDQTMVREMVPNKLLDLDAGLWPFGKARVRLSLEPVGPDRTRVRMYEVASSGFGRVVPHPLQALVLRPRNAEALDRLADIAVHRRYRPDEVS